MWSACCAARAQKCTAEEFLESVWKHINSRPPIGEIAIRSGRLTMFQVREVLRAQAEYQLPFGEAARKLRYLSEDDVDALLSQQDKMATSVEEFLLEMGVPSSDLAPTGKSGRRSMKMGRQATISLCSERLADSKHRRPTSRKGPLRAKLSHV